MKKASRKKVVLVVHVRECGTTTGLSQMDLIYLVRRLTGSSSVYPGHPLTTAFMVMKAFSNWEEANVPTKYGFSRALGSDVPGSGDAVSNAMRVLHKGSQGADIDEMVAYANELWVGYRAGGHEKSVEPGIKQARLIEPHFRAMAYLWFP